MLLPASCASGGNTSSITCGLTATTITAGGSGSEPMFARDVDAVRPSSSLARGGGAGSCTMMRAGSRPRSSQPASSADPMLPAPARSSVPSILSVMDGHLPR